MDVTLRNVEITDNKIQLGFVEHVEDQKTEDYVNAEHKVKVDKRDNGDLIARIQVLKPFFLVLMGFTSKNKSSEIEEHIKQRYSIAGFIVKGSYDKISISIKALKALDYDLHLMKVKSPPLPLKNESFPLTDQFETAVIDLIDYMETYIKEAKYLPEQIQMEMNFDQQGSDHESNEDIEEVVVDEDGKVIDGLELGDEGVTFVED